MRARRQHHRPCDRDDSGSAAVEFLTSVTLLTVLLIASIELGMYVYVRNIAQAAAVEAARYGAPIGRGESAARDRIDELMPHVFGGYAKGFQVRVGRTGEFVYVVVEGKVTPSTPLLPDLPVKAEAWAFQEERALDR